MNPYTVTPFTTDFGSSIPGEAGAPLPGLLRTPWPGLFIKDDHVPREQFSASQLETSVCQYLWGLQYLLGLRKPEKRIETREDELAALARLPTVEKRERSLLFGTLLHKRLERYFRGEAVDWTDDVGQRALVGLGYLPQSGPLRIEATITIQPNTVFGDLHLAFVGSADLEDPEILYDYKTTGNFRWMKRPDELRENLQACLYALSSMQRKGTRLQKCRWVYFASVGKPEARPVNFEITYDQAMAVVRSAYVHASTLRKEVILYRDMLAEVEYIEGQPDVVRRLPLIEHLPKNTGHCNSYGGCPMHSIAGGPCQAGPPMIDIGDVTEHQGDTQDMATLQDRLNAMSQQATQGQQPAPQANPFAAAPAPAPVPATAFGAVPVAHDVLTGPAPAVAPFNPGANPFAAAAPAPAPVAPQANPFAAPAPATAPAPAAPQFAASSLPPAAPMAQHQFGQNPFGAAPVQTPAPASNTEMQPRFPGVNSPEASTAITADQAAAQPQGKRKRRTQAEMQAARAGTVAPAVFTGVPGANTVATTGTEQQDGHYDVTITITDNESGAVITIPAPENIASMMTGALGSVLEGLR